MKSCSRPGCTDHPRDPPRHLSSAGCRCRHHPDCAPARAADRRRDQAADSPGPDRCRLKKRTELSSSKPGTWLAARRSWCPATRPNSRPGRRYLRPGARPAPPATRGRPAAPWPCAGRRAGRPPARPPPGARPYRGRGLVLAAAVADRMSGRGSAASPGDQSTPGTSPRRKWRSMIPSADVCVVNCIGAVFLALHRPREPVRARYQVHHPYITERSSCTRRCVIQCMCRAPMLRSVPYQAPA